MSVIVTGGTRGIGAGITKALCDSGALLTIGYQSDHQAAEKFTGELESCAGEVHAVSTDLTTMDGAITIVESALERYSIVDTLVSNMGPFLWRRISNTTPEEWDRMIAANLSSHFYLVSNLLPVMHENNKGNFIFIGGVGSGFITGHPLASAYNSAKVALAEFMRTLAIEEGPNGIRSNMIAPGIIDNGEYTDSYKERIPDEIPLRTIGEPDDIANAVKWLLSSESRYVNGSIIDVSGGYHLTINRNMID